VIGRYDASAERALRLPDGTLVRHLAPRILPIDRPGAEPASTEVRATEVDRLDLVSARTIGDPLLAWRLSDANDAMDPFDLCDRPGRVLRLPASDL